MAMMNKEQYNTNLGRALREMRLELGLTQEELAEKADLSRNHISAVERGEKSITVYALACILYAVDVPFDKFIIKV
ncbi:MAG TPA: helix-turn-helix transcriptional regulator [Thermoanaerobacterales bacterium]|nr:helix-turn-helix transcriptional regulator [Thermoanaerobacterales bacterium]